MSACWQASTGFRLGSRLGGSSDFNLFTDLDDHQIFAEFQWTGVGLPRRWNQILLAGVWQHYVLIHRQLRLRPRKHLSRLLWHGVEGDNARRPLWSDSNPL